MKAESIIRSTEYSPQRHWPSIQRYLDLRHRKQVIVNAGLYHYAGNNPVRYMDPDGRTIAILEDEKTILEFINKYSYYKYTVDENHHLIRDGNKTNEGITSKKYSAVIDAAINNDLRTIIIGISDIEVRKYSDGSLSYDYDVEKEGGGGVTCNFSSNITLVTITGRDSIYDIPLKNGKSHKYTPEEILMHELVGHAIPIVLNVTGGSAIFNENTIRKELKLDERKETNNDPVVNHHSNAKFLFMPN